MIEGDVLSVEEQDKIFLQVNPPDKHGRVYGIGSLGPPLAESFSVSQQPSSSSHSGFFTRSEVEELMTQTVTPLQNEIENLKAQAAQWMEFMTQQKDRSDPST